MLLAIDVGNTNVTVGSFDDHQLLKLWRLGTDLNKTLDEYGVALKAVVGESRSRRIDAVIYGSVVPALDPIFEKAVTAYFGVPMLRVAHDSPLGIRLKVDHPEEVGVDRILNTLAAHKLYGGPAVVLDFGTATTFDCVSPHGDYLGGAILIGPKVAAEALAQRTAQLPQVELRKPGHIIGTNTVECIQAGLYYGYIGMIERVLGDTLQDMPFHAGDTRGSRKRTRIKGSRTHVIATGGLAALFAKDIPAIQKLVPDLTLQGLRIAYEILHKIGPSGRG